MKIMVDLEELLKEFGFSEDFPDSKPGIFYLTIGRFVFSIMKTGPKWEFRICNDDGSSSPIYRFVGPLGKCLIQAGILTSNVLANVATLLIQSGVDLEDKEETKIEDEQSDNCRKESEEARGEGS